MEYRETLPPDCPPPSALSITEQTVRYRLLEGTTPTQRDFDSYVKRNVEVNRRSRRTPCEQNGVSLWTSLEAVQGVMTGRPNRRRRNTEPRWQAIGELTISAGAGKLNPVEPNGHQTWWPSKAFDPVGNCKVMP